MLTFESSKTERLSPEALDILHTVDNDGTSEDVGEREYMELLQAGAGLAG